MLVSIPPLQPGQRGGDRGMQGASHARNPSHLDLAQAARVRAVVQARRQGCAGAVELEPDGVPTVQVIIMTKHVDKGYRNRDAILSA